jgi:hypothetical protein
MESVSKATAHDIKVVKNAYKEAIYQKDNALLALKFKGVRAAKTKTRVAVKLVANDTFLINMGSARDVYSVVLFVQLQLLAVLPMKDTIYNSLFVIPSSVLESVIPARVPISV